MIVHIKNLRLRTIIGTLEWERQNKQDVVLNIKLKFDARKAATTDNIEDTVDYKNLTKRIISEVENSGYHLLEKLAQHVLNVIMDDQRIRSATVEIDKPQALRFADSVSITCSAERNDEQSSDRSGGEH
ncbi:dihydroneopterin aldolase [candidate division KSB1 bacterium]|nr:dihydroneopterin aldolase [candidate division KSB1 bacterium]